MENKKKMMKQKNFSFEKIEKYFKIQTKMSRKN